MSLSLRTQASHRCYTPASNESSSIAARPRAPSSNSNLPSLVFRRRRGPATSTRPSSSSSSSSSSSFSSPTAAASTSGSSASTSNSSSKSSSRSSSSPSRSPWRLGSYLSPPLALLAASLEGAWHANLSSSGLELVELDPGVEYRDSAEEKDENATGGDDEKTEPEKLDFESVDAMRAAVEAAAACEAARLARLEKMRLVVENRVYSSAVFRKIHLELALRGDGLQVLHCVLFPRLEFDLPILSMDLVAAPLPPTPKTSSSSSSSSSDPASLQPPLLPDSVVSLAIIDPCPARLDGSLPEPYRDVVVALQRECGVASNRSQPEWGREIFSEACILTRPAGDEDLLKRFLRYALSLHSAHLTFADNLFANRGESRRGKTKQQRLRERAATAAAHARYRDKQLQNGATRGVLAAAFGKEWADRYMEEVMFDVEGV